MTSIDKTYWGFEISMFYEPTNGREGENIVLINILGHYIQTKLQVKFDFSLSSEKF